MTSNQQRRLSFVDDQSMSDIDKKRPSQLAPINGLSSERRQSIWNPSRKSVNNRRLSFSMSQGSRKSSQDLIDNRIRLQNTYRTEPNEHEKFMAYKLEPKLYALLEEALKDEVYDASKTSILVKDLSQQIMRETRLVMNSSSPRYKLIAHATIGEMKNQDIRFGSRCLWDNNLDNVASVVYKNSYLFAVATIFAVYFE